MSGRALLSKLGWVLGALVLALLFGRACLSRPAAFDLALDVDGGTIEDARVVVVFLHGYGGNIDRSEWFVDRLRARELPQGTVIVRVEAPLIVPPLGRAWWKSPPDRGINGERLARTLARIRERATQARGHVFVAGFSQGATMALDRAAEVDGVFALSGCDLRAPAQLPALLYIAHGTRDHICPFAPTAGLVRTLESAGTPVRFDTFADDHVVPDSVFAAIAEQVVAAAP